MGNFSTLTVNALLNVAFGKAAYTSPSTNVYLHLLTVYTESTETLTELSMTGTGYSAIAIPITTGLASASSRSITNAADIVSDPATTDWSTLVGWYISAGSTINSSAIAHGELLGPEIRCTVDASTNVFTSASHGLTSGQRVRARVLGGTLPSPLSTGTSYYVTVLTSNTFQLSAAPSGTPVVDLTDVGRGLITVHLDYIQAVTQGGKFTIPAGALVISIPVRS